MIAITLGRPADFEGWRAAARQLLLAWVPPDEIHWQIEGETADLFAKPPELASTFQSRRDILVPRAFMGLAEQAACHRDPERYALLYRLLWRLQKQPKLMHDVADPDVRQIQILAQAVKRDLHKMKAFVRFRRIMTAEPEHYVAWFEPEQHIVDVVAPFFARRFAGMRWSILTPERSVHWDGVSLRFGPGASRSDAPLEDQLEEIWRTYFASVFNPARLKVKAMTSEMPKKYWRNLPEAQLIGPLIQDAGRRSAAMIEEPMPQPPPAPPATLEQLARLAQDCTRCPLYQHASQTVFGEGPADAPLMLVGEQPGDQEDRQGRPFIGPAGQLLDQALAEAGIARDQVYVTNAVKHFKFEPRGKRRLHKRPNNGEIQQCRWWLEQERALVRPKLIVAMGATAAYSLLQTTTSISKSRGRQLATPDGTALLITVHPSFLLRLPDAASKAEQYHLFVQDLGMAAGLLTGGGHA